MDVIKQSGRMIRLHTGLGEIQGTAEDGVLKFLGVPFAKAGRFEYAQLADNWKDLGTRLEDGALDASEFGPACPQCRQFDLHLDNPKRLFYHKEYRDGLVFKYDEECLNLNIYAPAEAKNAPVIVFIYGGGFDSGSNSEQPFDGSGFARRGVIAVFINYRVGVLGYITHEEIKKQFGREGNFGLDDQRTGIRWVKEHIADFGGDPENITLLGQSAGAISIQYLCLDPNNKGLFNRAAMMSGGGMFPRFALPKAAESTRSYWIQLMQEAGCKSFEELKALDLASLFKAVEIMKIKRKDTIYFVMPVMDGALIPRPVPELIGSPLPLDYMIGYTNTDMYAPALTWVGDRFGKKNGAYIYYFDIDAPGDGNGAFHSCDLRYMFERLEESWRPYGQRDREAAAELATYMANFAKTGDPNGESLARWERAKPALIADVLRIAPQGTFMAHPQYLKLTKRFLSIGDPKA